MKTRLIIALATMIATGAMATSGVEQDDYATRLYRAKGLRPPSFYQQLREKSRPTTLALFKSETADHHIVILKHKKIHAVDRVKRARHVDEFGR